MKSKIRAENFGWSGEPCPSCIGELGKFSRWRRAHVLRFTNAICCCQPHYTRSHSLARWLQNTPKPCKRPAPRISVPLISSAVNGGSSACCSSSRPLSAAPGRVPTRPPSSCPSPAPICAISLQLIAILRGASARKILVGKSPGRARPGFSLPTAKLHSAVGRHVKPFPQAHACQFRGHRRRGLCAAAVAGRLVSTIGCRHGFLLPSVERVSTHSMNSLGRSIFARLHFLTCHPFRSSLVPHPSYP